MELKTITIGELKKQLAWLTGLPDDTEIFFGAGNLSFVRAKTRLYRRDNVTPQRVQIEFMELYAITEDFSD